MMFLVRVARWSLASSLLVSLQSPRSFAQAAVPCAPGTHYRTTWDLIANGTPLIADLRRETGWPPLGGWIRLQNGNREPISNIEFEPKTCSLQFRRLGNGFVQWFAGQVVGDTIANGRFSHADRADTGTPRPASSAYTFSFTGKKRPIGLSAKTTTKGLEIPREFTKIPKKRASTVWNANTGDFWTALMNYIKFYGSVSASEYLVPSEWSCGNGAKASRGAACFGKSVTERHGIGCNYENPISDRRAIERAEIRGWLLGNPEWVDDNEENSFSILLDVGWKPATSDVTPINTISAVNKVLTPHNIVVFGSNRSLNDISHIGGAIWGGTGAAVIHVEINGVRPGAERDGRLRGLPRPPDFFEEPATPGVFWPFSLSEPPTWRPAGRNEPQGRLQFGDYVRLVGTLWEDEHHGACLEDDNTVRKKARGCWADGSTYSIGWTEMHPVDYLARIDREDAAHSWLPVEKLAICDRPECRRSWGKKPTSTVEVLAACEGTKKRTYRRRIFAPPRPPYQAELFYSMDVEGDAQAGYHGAINHSSIESHKVTLVPGQNAIDVEIKTSGKNNFKFKAAYEVGWKLSPPPPPTPTVDERLARVSAQVIEQMRALAAAATKGDDTAVWAAHRALQNLLSGLYSYPNRDLFYQLAVGYGEARRHFGGVVDACVKSGLSAVSTRSLHWLRNCLEAAIPAASAAEDLWLAIGDLKSALVRRDARAAMGRLSFMTDIKSPRRPAVTVPPVLIWPEVERSIPLLMGSAADACFSAVDLVTQTSFQRFLDCLASVVSRAGTTEIDSRLRPLLTRLAAFYISGLTVDEARRRLRALVTEINTSVGQLSPREWALSRPLVRVEDIIGGMPWGVYMNGLRRCAFKVTEISRWSLLGFHDCVRALRKT